MSPEHDPGRFAEIELLEIPALEAGLGPRIAARVSRRLRVPCRVATPPPGFVVPELPSRDQVDADRLLEALEALEGPPGRVRVGVTPRDMGHPIFTHFFGRARRGGRAVVVSTARLDAAFYGLAPDGALAVERTVVEILHELGHVAGLGHCRDWGCVMHFAATVEDLDNRGDGFCVRCGETLPPELEHAVLRSA